MTTISLGGNANLIRPFLQKMNVCKSDVLIYSGKYITNAKSLIGIFQVDTAKEFTIDFSDSDEEKTILNELKNEIGLIIV